MGIGTLAAAYGVVQQILGHARLHELGYEYNSVLRFNGGFLRSVSTFALPFSFGFYMMMVIVICLPVALSDPSRLRNRLFLIATPLLVVGLATSIVRTAMLGLLVGAAVHRHPPLPLGDRRARAARARRPVLHPRLERHRRPCRRTPRRPARPTGRRTSTPSPTIRSASASARPVRPRPARTARPSEEQAAAFGIDLTQPDADVYTPILGGNGVYQPDNYYFKTVIELGVLGLWFLIRILVGAVRESRALERVPDRDGRRARHRHDRVPVRRHLLDVLRHLPRAVPDGRLLLVAARHHRGDGARVRHRPPARGVSAEPVAAAGAAR